MRENRLCAGLLSEDKSAIYLYSTIRDLSGVGRKADREGQRGREIKAEKTGHTVLLRSI